MDKVIEDLQYVWGNLNALMVVSKKDDSFYQLMDELTTIMANTIDSLEDYRNERDTKYT